MLSLTREKIKLNHFITNICQALPQSALAVEDILIRENRVIVRYKTKPERKDKDLSLIKNSRFVTVNSIDALRLQDGKVMEHRDPVYQIKTSLENSTYS